MVLAADASSGKEAARETVLFAAHRRQKLRRANNIGCRQSQQRSRASEGMKKGRNAQPEITKANKSPALSRVAQRTMDFQGT